MDAIGVAVFLSAMRGASDRAQELGERGLASGEDTGDVVWRAYIEFSLGVDSWLQGDFAKATTLAVAAMETTPDHLLLTNSIELLAWCASSEGLHAEAARLFGAADRRWEQLGGALSAFSGLSAHHDRNLETTKQHLSTADFRAAYGSGRMLSLAEIVAAAETTKASSPIESHRAGQTRLTAREREVALLVAKGMSNREIAEALTISQRTAESHVEHILTKLNLPNRTQLATWMVTTNL
jgi:non-specific serine/threonine protein kinase